MYSKLVIPELVFFRESFDDQEDFFKEVSKKLLELGYVTEGYFKAVVEREVSYPTGLALENISIAIPHTNPEFIVKPFIAAYHLTNTVAFTQMATQDVTTQSELILALGIKEPQEQVGMLSKIIEVLNDPEFVKEYQSLSNQEQLVKLLKSKF